MNPPNPKEGNILDYSYDYLYGMDDEMGAAIGMVYIIYYLITIGLGIAGYVLSSLGLSTIAKRRGISKPWLAWIPVANMWIVGSISDQYRYVSKGQIKNKRKILLGLEIGIIAVTVAMFVGMVIAALSLEGAGEEAAVALVLVMLLVMLVVLIVSLVFTVFYYMAMYDLYTSVNPPNNVVFLVLSIIFRVTEPFFIFFNRKKDGGMPPRCDIPTQPRPAIAEPWENVTGE